MWNLLKSELLKLRRCQILLVGLVALALCPLVQYGSQLIVEAEYRNPNYDFSALFENVVWGNTQIFLPISLVMIGGWLIDRESTHDTLKNIMTIPVSMPKMLGAKLLLVGMLAVPSVTSSAQSIARSLPASRFTEVPPNKYSVSEKSS
jgi:bacitracin transport system permease protein